MEIGVRQRALRTKRTATQQREISPQCVGGYSNRSLGVEHTADGDAKVKPMVKRQPQCCCFV